MNKVVTEKSHNIMRHKSYCDLCSCNITVIWLFSHWIMTLSLHYCDFSQLRLFSCHIMTFSNEIMTFFTYYHEFFLIIWWLYSLSCSRRGRRRHIRSKCFQRVEQSNKQQTKVDDRDGTLSPGAPAKPLNKGGGLLAQNGCHATTELVQYCCWWSEWPMRDAVHPGTHQTQAHCANGAGEDGDVWASPPSPRVPLSIYSQTTNSWSRESTSVHLWASGWVCLLLLLLLLPHVCWCGS